MENLGAILLALFGGAFLVILVGGLATLIVLHIRLKKSQFETVKHIDAKVQEISQLIEGARSSFTGIRQEMRTALDKQDKAFADKIGKINGEALTAACVRAVAASNKIVQVSNLLQRMIAEGGEPATDEKLAPDQYAPGDTVYAVPNRTARADELAQELENLETFTSAE